MNGLDLRTLELPVELSMVNMNLSLDDLCLTECAIDGILDIYVVERRFAADEELELGEITTEFAWREGVLAGNTTGINIS